MTTHTLTPPPTMHLNPVPAAGEARGEAGGVAEGVGGAARASATAPSVQLTTLSRGQRAVIRETRMPTDDAALLRAMGLCDCALLTVARTGEPFIVTVSGVDGADCKCHKVGGCRIGLARAMAERIFVSVLN